MTNTCIDFTKPVNLIKASKARPASGMTYYTHSGDKYPNLALGVGKTKASWYVRGRINGKSVSQSLKLTYPDTSPDAAMKALHNRTAHASNEATAEIRTLWDAWREYRAHASASTRHLDDIGRKLEREANALMRKHPADVSLIEVRRVLMNIESIATRHHVKAGLNNCYSILDIASPIPRGKLKAKELGKVGKRTTLWKDYCDATRHDARDWSPIWETIMQMGNTTRRDAWIVMLFTGIRATDVRSLEWDQVDFARRQLKFTGLKNGEDRNIPVCDTVMNILEARRSNHAHVFAADSKTGYIDHLDNLKFDGHAIMRQHDTRRHFTSACGPARVPSYAAAYLRGDITSQNSDDDMLMHYSEDLDLHACVADIERVIIKRIGESFEVHF